MDAFSGRIGTAFSGDAVDDAPTLLETAHFHPIDKSIGAIAAFFYPRATVKFIFLHAKAPRWSSAGEVSSTPSIRLN